MKRFAAGLLLALALSHCAHADVYKDFAELAAANTAGDDYRISVDDRRSTATVFAIHGGTIERGASEIARALAGSDWNLYLFEGLKKKGAKRLHVSAEYFDEPSALELARRSVIAVSVHKQRGSGESVCVGGANAVLRRSMAQALRNAGIRSEEPCRRLPGDTPSNIVNRAVKGGVQLELTRAVIRALLKDPARLRLFCDAVRRAAQP
ncbi:MAG: poly-gamma-glutamate hydrolase family protein [Elusimicrobia bacterium]|nr:poly-gamma-glutamate hydrolase family protein [Elusimicrobiota bacterium]